MESDPAAGIGIPLALAAGLVSFLSPCVLPLVPGYLAAVTGVSVGEIERADWRRVLVPSLIFVATFSAIFILLGLSATAIGSALSDHKHALEQIGGAVMVLLGVLILTGEFTVLNAKANTLLQGTGLDVSNI